MNPFNELLNDDVFILSDDGIRQGPFKSTIGKGIATIFDASLDVEEGDKLLKPLPNGKNEIYTVVETKFNNDFHGIPAHYKLTLKKDTSLVERSKNTTVNIHNSQGIQVGDHNIQNIAVSLQNLVHKIDEQNASEAEKAEAKGILRQLLEHPLVASILGGLASGIGA